VKLTNELDDEEDTPQNEERQKGIHFSFLSYLFLKNAFFSWNSNIAASKNPYSAEAVKERLDKFLKQQEKYFVNAKPFVNAEPFVRVKIVFRRRKEKKSQNLQN